MEGDLHQKGHEAFFYALNDADMVSLSDLLAQYKPRLLFSKNYPRLVAEEINRWLNDSQQGPLSDMVGRLQRGEQEFALLQNVLPNATMLHDQQVAHFMQGLSLLLGYEKMQLEQMTAKNKPFPRSSFWHVDGMGENKIADANITMLYNWQGGEHTLLHIGSNQSTLAELTEKERAVLSSRRFVRRTKYGAPRLTIPLSGDTMSNDVFNGYVSAASNNDTEAIAALNRLTEVIGEKQTAASIEFAPHDLVIIMNQPHAVQDIASANEEHPERHHTTLRAGGPKIPFVMQEREYERLKIRYATTPPRGLLR